MVPCKFRKVKLRDGCQTAAELGGWLARSCFADNVHENLNVLTTWSARANQS